MLSGDSSCFVNRVLFKPVLGGVAGVAHFITGHVHTQLESSVFISLAYSLLPKALTIQNLLIFTAAGVVPCGGNKMAPCTSSQCRLYVLGLWDHRVLQSYFKMEFCLSRCYGVWPMLHVSSLVMNRLN